MVYLLDPVFIFIMFVNSLLFPFGSGSDLAWERTAGMLLSVCCHCCFFFTFSFCTLFPFVALWIILHGFACVSSPVASDGNYFAVLSKTEKEIIVPILSTDSS